MATPGDVLTGQSTDVPSLSEALGLDTLLVGGDSLTGSDEYEMLLKAARDLNLAYGEDRGFRDEAIGMDLDTIARLDRVSRGVQPSPAEAAMRKTIQQSADQSQGLASTLGGANPGAAIRSGLEARDVIQSQSAGELEALRAREMDAARALLAQQTSKGRGTAVSGAVGTGNTYLGVSGAPFGARSMESAADAAREAAMLQATGTVAANYQKNNPPAGVPKYETYDPFAADPVTSSDIKGKTDVQPSPAMADDLLSAVSGATAAPVTARGLTGDPIQQSAADAFLSTLHPQSFKYKAPDGVNKKPGTRMGVMAQDLPDHDVVTGPDGKKWISADVISDVLAGMGRLNEKVDAKTGASRGGRATRQQTGAAISEEERRRMMAQQTPQQPAEVMIPQSAVHDYLAGLGIVPP